MDIYSGKDWWHPSSPTRFCTYCHGPIAYRPATIGIAEGTIEGTIKTRGYFCSWPCARAFGNTLPRTEELERLTSLIMSDFRGKQDQYDDPDGFKFLQKYMRFSSVHSAPPLDEFSDGGGPLSHEKFRETWVDMIDSPYDVKVNSASDPTVRPYLQWQPDSSVSSVASPRPVYIGHSGFNTRQFGGLHRTGYGNGWGSQSAWH